MRRRSMAWAILGTAGLFAIRRTASAAYPERPVTLVVPFAPGGGTDILGRLVADHLRGLLNQPFVVENRPGAGATIGASHVARATPDGYTLLVGTSAELTIGPTLLSPQRYDPVKDFAPIALLGSSANALLAHPGYSPRNVAELMRDAAARPQGVSYASGGVGTGPHLSGELLQAMTGMHLSHVPYRGSGPALSDVMSGQVPLMFATLAAALPVIRDGRVRALAVTSATRSSELPDVPTVAEQGLPGYESVTWYAVLAPAGTPAEALTQLRGAIETVLRTPALQARLRTLGIEAPAQQPDMPAMRARIHSELLAWARLIRENDIRAE